MSNGVREKEQCHLGLWTKCGEASGTSLRRHCPAGRCARSLPGKGCLQLPGFLQRENTGSQVCALGCVTTKWDLSDEDLVTRGMHLEITVADLGDLLHQFSFFGLNVNLGFL